MPSPATPLAGIVIPESSLLLAAVAEQSAYSHELTLHNPDQSQPVDLTLEASCHCTAIEPSTLHLAPGESQPVRLTMDLTDTSPLSAGRLEWPFQVKLVAKALDAQGKWRSRQWNLSATVQRPLVANPPAIGFSGAYEILQGDAAVFPVRLRSRDPLANVRAEVRPALVVHVNGNARSKTSEVSEDFGSLARDATHQDHPARPLGTVTVRLDDADHLLEYVHGDTTQTGEFAATLHVTATSASGVALPEVVIPVTGRVVAPYRLTPSDLVLAPQPVGTEVTRTVAITSLQGKPFRVELMEPLIDTWSVDWAARADESAPQPLTLSTRLMSAGNQSWELPLRIHPLAEPTTPIELKLVVRAYGLPAERTVAATKGSR